MNYKIFKKNILNKIILINIITFTISWIYIGLSTENTNIEELKEKISEILGASSSFNKLISEPWSIITHMFTHINTIHFIFNLFFLYFFGKLFILLIGEKKMLLFYITGGIFGYLIYSLGVNSLNIFTEDNIILGASASIFAIASTCALFSPNYKISIPILNNIKLSHLVILYILFHILAIPFTENKGGGISHVGGAIYGFIYFLMNKKKQIKTKSTREMSDEEWRTSKKNKEKKLNEILDKISKSGFDSLNEYEKNFLKKSK